MIMKTEQNLALGIIRRSIVKHKDEFFFVSTVNLQTRSRLNPLAEWRNDWWPPKYPNETMVWQADQNHKRIGDILHCQGHRKPKSAECIHRQLCVKIEKIGQSALNGQQMQTSNEVTEPTGLIKQITKDLQEMNSLEALSAVSEEKE